MKEQKFQRLTGLMALLVFAVLAFCVMLVLLSGADVYQRLTEEGESQYQRRTAAQYITTRVRQAESVRVEDFGGEEALVFPETVNGRVYLTRVYCYDGYLRELFTAESGTFQPQDGEKLMEAADLEASLSGSALSVRITLPDGSCRDLTLAIREEEAGQ